MKNKIAEKVIWGVSTLIGLIVAEGIYKASVRTIENRELIGEAEVISEEIVEES